MGISIWSVSLLLLVVVAEVSSLVSPNIIDSRSLKTIRPTFHLSSLPPTGTNPDDDDDDDDDMNSSPFDENDNYDNEYFSVNGVPRINGYTMPEGNSKYSAGLRERGRPFERFLQPGSLPLKSVDEEDEDGWGSMRKRKRVWWKSIIRAPLKVAKKILEPAVTEPGTLILVRHGESLWNANKTFTGWADPDLSERGEREVEHAARLLLEGGYEIDVCFTSRLKRAIRSTWIILDEMNEVYLPVFKSWRLNERCYGLLTGLSKKETAEQLGSELVQEWRGSLRSRPPALSVSDAYWPGKDRKYADLTLDQIPLTESLMDCMDRATPVWENKIVYELRQGKNVMVIAHANTLRGLVKTIDNIGDDEIREVAIPTGTPILATHTHTHTRSILYLTTHVISYSSPFCCHVCRRYTDYLQVRQEHETHPSQWRSPDCQSSSYEGTLSGKTRSLEGGTHTRGGVVKAGTRVYSNNGPQK